MKGGAMFDETSPAVLRVYQTGNSAHAGTVNITSSNGTIVQDLNVDIKASNDPSRTLIIDLFDPDTSDPNNIASLVGTVYLYGENINYSNTGGGGSSS